MRNNKLIAGSSIVIVAAVGFIFSKFYLNQSGIEQHYAPRTTQLDHIPKIADEHQKLRKELLTNYQTGVFDPQDWLNAREDALRFDQENDRAATLSWVEKGPDNIGGRTRAILIDVQNINHVFAGSVSGGLFESFDGGNTWQKVNGFSENLSISTIAQATVAPYKILIGTGHNREGFISNGIYESDDNGVTWTQNTSSASFTDVNEIVYATTQNKFYITSSAGLKEYSGTAAINSSIVTATGNGVPLGGCEGMAISPNGRVIVFGRLSGGTQTYISNDYGANWVNVGGSIGAGKVPTAGARTEYAVSPSTINGKHLVYASSSSNIGLLTGIYVSENDGTDGSWLKIAETSSVSFQPFTTGGGGQGTYDNIISVHPTLPYRAYLGGIDLYQWNANTSITPVYGQWEQLSAWFLPPQSPNYVHADNHEMKWDANGKLYIGNDGGIGISPSFATGQAFYPANRGYNVTQFYSVAYSKHGDVIGGTQDNGTLYNDYTNATWMEFEEVMGGDGFDCDISFLNPDVMFASIYYGGLSRSSDRGFVWSNFFSNTMINCGTPGGLSGGFGSFYTVGRLWETDNDLNSTDSVAFIPSETMYPGDTVSVTSYSIQIPLSATLTDTLIVIDTIFPSGVLALDSLDTINVFLNPLTLDTLKLSYNNFLANVALDTFMIQDPVQSWYAIGFTPACSRNGGVWFTRDALRFGNNPFWWFVDLGITGFNRVSCIEFSADGNHMYVGSTGGTIHRISGIASLYGNQYDPGYATNNPDSLPTGVTVTLIHTGASSLTGIAIDPNDPGHVVLTRAGTGAATHVFESTTADVAVGTGSFTSIQGNLPNTIPLHDAIIDMSNPNLIVVGSEFGVYATDDGGTTWTDNTGEFGKVPVYAVRQNWRTWNEGNNRPGEIYLGTHGRGIWASGSYLNLPDVNHNDYANVDFISDILVYPNPMAENGNLSFDLSSSAQVNIRIFNLAGKKVKEINAGSLSSGNHTIDLSTEGLPGGTYFIQLQAGTEVKTAKFIVSR